MKKMITIIAGLLFMSGCASEGKFIGANKDNECGGKGKVRIEVVYGDAFLKATPKSNAKRRGQVIYDLKPRNNQESGIDYSEVEVTIAGKTGSANWLNKKGKAREGRDKVFICVPQNQGTGAYDFSVEVPGVGKLDPRVNVTN